MGEVITIERMAYGPEAIGHLADGKTAFVAGAAPGDTCEIEIVEDKGSFVRARVAELHETSDARVAPASPIDQVCGTAPWQHLSYDAQLLWKRENVVGALVHTAGFDPAQADELVAACAPSKRQWGYRNKLELAVGADAAGAFELGFHREGTNEFVAADSSKLVHKQIERAPKALRGAIRYAQGNQDLGIFRIGVRHSLATGECEVALWTRPGKFPRALFSKTIGSAVKATSVVRVLADPGKARKVKGVEVLDGRGFWRERMGECEFSTQAPSFFQVNTAQAQRLVEEVVRGLDDGEGIEGAYIADLYAGGGTFSIPLARAGADVVAVEAAGSSVRDLRYNADLNGVEVDVVGGDAARELAMLEDLDALVVDPPRAGLAKEVPGLISQAGPLKVAYVSCNPSTWARDIARFAEHGYQLQSAVPVDLFPQTYHVEVASILSRQ